jgi:hypothetical protein
MVSVYAGTIDIEVTPEMLAAGHRHSLTAFQTWKRFPHLRRSPVRWRPMTVSLSPANRSLLHLPAIAHRRSRQLPRRRRSLDQPSHSLDRLSAGPSPN